MVSPTAVSVGMMKYNYSCLSYGESLFPFLWEGGGGIDMGGIFSLYRPANCEAVTSFPV